jgi:hypothetical protein
MRCTGRVPQIGTSTPVAATSCGSAANASRIARNAPGASSVAASTVNIQGLIDLISRAGNLTSEFAAFKSASFWGKAAMIAGALTTLAGLIGSTFPNSHLAVLVGSIGAAVGVLVTAGTSIHYVQGRQNLKANAQSVLGAIQSGAGGLSTLVAALPTPVVAAPPAAAPVVVNIHPPTVLGPPSPTPAGSGS